MKKTKWICDCHPFCEETRPHKGCKCNLPTPTSPCKCHCHWKGHEEHFRYDNCPTCIHCQPTEKPLSTIKPKNIDKKNLIYATEKPTTNPKKISSQLVVESTEKLVDNYTTTKKDRLTTEKHDTKLCPKCNPLFTEKPMSFKTYKEVCGCETSSEGLPTLHNAKNHKSMGWEREAQGFMDKLNIFDLEILNSIVYHKRDEALVAYKQKLIKRIKQDGYEKPRRKLKNVPDWDKGYTDGFNDVVLYFKEILEMK